MSPGLDPLLDGEMPSFIGVQYLSSKEAPIADVELLGQGGLVVEVNIFVLDVRDSKLSSVGLPSGNGVVSFLDSWVDGANHGALTKNMGWSIVLREGKRVFVPGLEHEAFFLRIAWRKGWGVCSVGQKQEEEGSAQLKVGEANSGLIQDTTKATPTQTLFCWWGSNEVDNLGFIVIPSLAEHVREISRPRKELPPAMVLRVTKGCGLD